MIESIALNTHFGIELLKLEPQLDAVQAVCKTAHEVKTPFHRLEVLDTLIVGGRRFLRCRSDVLNPFPMLDLLFLRGRSIITPSEKGYFAKLKDGRVGPVTNVAMHSTPKLGQRTVYRGPRIKLWERQFA
jgi:hypothetical protein